MGYDTEDFKYHLTLIKILSKKKKMQQVEQIRAMIYTRKSKQKYREVSYYSQKIRIEDK